VIRRLWCLNDGTTWIQTGRGDHERGAGVFTVLDVFDADGRSLGQRALQVPGDPFRDALHLLRDGRVVVVTGAADA
jgi:hypothetical protein